MSRRAPVAIYYDMAEGDSTSSTRQSEPALKLILLRELVRGRDRPLHSRPISTKSKMPASGTRTRLDFSAAGATFLSYQRQDHLISSDAIISVT